MRVRAGAAAVAGALTALALGLPAGPAGAAEPAPDCGQVRTTDAPRAYDGTSRPLELLGVPRAQHLLDDQPGDPGAGVNVAVLDSGVVHAGGIDVVDTRNLTGLDELRDPHGSAVAGLVAGGPGPDGQPVGVAPGAGIVDVRVYDSGQEPRAADERPVDPDRLAAGLDWVADNADRDRIGVANVSLAVDPTPALARAVRRVLDADVALVASSGNRPEEGDLGYGRFGKDAPERGEDAAGLVHPAAYPGVVAVNATAAPTGEAAASYVLQSSDTDVAAPTFGALSVAVNGALCRLPEIATSWSAAEVSGVLALIRARYPDDSAEQAVARLLATAAGTPTTRSWLTGAGVVQPYDALTRPLAPGRDGRLELSVVQHDERRAVPPPRPDDLLAGARDDAVWWGLVGGGVLVVALLLRPVLARRR